MHSHCPHCGAEAVRATGRGDLDRLVVDSIDLAAPVYGELLGRYAGLIQEAANPEMFFAATQGKASLNFLLSLGTGLFEGIAQAAMIGKSEASAARSVRFQPPPIPPVNGGGPERRAVVTGYQGNPVELDWFRQQAFTVSGIEEQAVLEKLKIRIEEFLRGEGSWDDFRRTAVDELGRIGQTISDSRLETVFSTNLATAHGAGKWLEGQAAADVLPYWQYVTAGDTRVRPAHQLQDGKVYPKNHPYWVKWFPPNGYRCRCTVTEHDAASLKRYGLKVESDVGDAVPDQGFDTSPADIEGLLRRLIDENRLSDYTADHYDLGTLAATQLGQTAQTLGLGNGPAQVLDFEQVPRLIRSVDVPDGLTRDRAEQMVRATLEGPTEVWTWAERPNRYLRKFRDGDRDWTVVVEVFGDVERATITTGNEDDFRRGLLSHLGN